MTFFQYLKQGDIIVLRGQGPPVICNKLHRELHKANQQPLEAFQALVFVGHMFNHTMAVV